LTTADAKHIDLESAPPRAWLMGVVAWLVPGLGHLLQRRWWRALLLGGAVWICFIAGFQMGGHLFKYSGTEPGFSALLQIPPMIGDLGSGLLYIACWLWDYGFAHGEQQAALPTFEYGWTFLLVAGLINYLAMLDAFDIAAGRKS
jgi:hypothetical protein